MKKILDLITEELQNVLKDCGYDPQYGKVGISNRPDLCEYQCNGAMAAAKIYKKAPIMIAKEVTEKLQEKEMFEEISAVMPGFINIKINKAFLADYLNQMRKEEDFGCEKEENPKTIIVDYGGANVAKPLHVGHLRSAIIGESVKRIMKFFGNRVIGDVHLGDWGLQMGLIIEEVKNRKPELPYFKENETIDFSKEEPPFTISELEEIYPTASEKSKKDEKFKERAHQATYRLQNGDPAYTALWQMIMKVSKEDLKKNYDNLQVEFDLWKGESDAQPYIPSMIEDMVERKIAYESQGALVVDVTQEEDSKEIPPCLIKKSDGASLYATSDLATIVQREQDYQPNHYIYLADKRQELHFTQVFRVARKASLVSSDCKMDFLGFGTMNGKDGKPFKTREGGVMRLEYLIKEIYEAVCKKMEENPSTQKEHIEETAKIIGLAAIKYGDLSNQASKDYIFDIERFSSFEGNTGPYILYTIVRIKSILNKYVENGGDLEKANKIQPAYTKSEKDLMLVISKLSEVLESSYQEIAPHRICQYLYELAENFNSFYHNVVILKEEEEEKKYSWITLLKLTKEVLETCIDLLGFQAPERM